VSVYELDFSLGNNCNQVNYGREDINPDHGFGRSKQSREQKDDWGIVLKKCNIVV
jgi:hypothetical protein